MSIKKINEKAEFSIEKIGNKKYIVKTDSNITEFKFDSTIKDMYEAFEICDFNFDNLKKDARYTEISDTLLKDTVAKDSAVETFTTMKTNNQKIVIPELPTQYKGYYFPTWRNALARRVNIGKYIYLAGKAGCGKSEMIMKMADFCGQRYIRINMHSGMANADLIGRMLVKTNPETGTAETVFKYGYIPMAMLNGWWIILDEIDSAEPNTLFRLQPILEGNPMIVNENEGEIITPHDNFRIFTTGNTKGRGDEENSYAGTNFMNASFLDRFSLFEMDYTSKEVDIVNNILNDQELSDKLIQVFNIFRNSIEDGQMTNSVFSTRRLKSVAECLKAGDTLKEAFEYEVIGRYSKDEQKILNEFIKDVFEPTHYLNKKWTLGMAHAEKKVDVVQTTTESVLQPLA